MGHESKLGAGIGGGGMFAGGLGYDPFRRATIFAVVSPKACKTRLK
jgi:hypothetical protein